MVAFLAIVLRAEGAVSFLLLVGDAAVLLLVGEAAVFLLAGAADFLVMLFAPAVFLPEEVVALISAMLRFLLLQIVNDSPKIVMLWLNIAYCRITRMRVAAQVS